jgi:hypothetical protein
MRMGGFSCLARRLPPVTHTDALFAEQSQSILDDLVALLEPQSSTELLSRIRAVCSGHYSICGPLPHGFVADNDAAGGQQLLHHAKPDREAEIQPHCMTDDLGPEPISAMRASACRHPIGLLTPMCPRASTAGSIKLTVPIQLEQPGSALQLGNRRL